MEAEAAPPTPSRGGAQVSHVHDKGGWKVKMFVYAATKTPQTPCGKQEKGLAECRQEPQLPAEEGTEQTHRHRSVGVSLLEVRKTDTHITEHFKD